MQANKDKLKKVIIITIAAILVLLIATYVLTVVLEHLKSSSGGTNSVPQDSILVFPPADYNENIFDDEIYMTFNRGIKFTQGGFGITLSEQDLETYGVSAKLFFDYFGDVMNGRYEAYGDYFTDRYKKDVKLPERFTMQNVYDIDVQLFSREVIDDSSKKYRETYEVRYKIRNNNGTLRNDVESDTIKPIVFELIVDDQNNTADIDDIYPVVTIDVPDE